MIIIGLGKEGLEDGKKYNVGFQVAEILCSRGLAYKEGEEKPEEPKKTTRKRTSK